MKPKNLFNAYINAIEKLEKKWFKANNSGYKMEIRRSLIPMLIMGIAAVLLVACGYGHENIVYMLAILLEMTFVGLFIWYIVTQVRRDRAEGLQPNYFRQYGFVLLGTAIYLYIMDPGIEYRYIYARMLTGTPEAFYLPGILRSILYYDGYIPIPGIFTFFSTLIESPESVLEYGYDITRICFIAIWFNHLYHRWGNLTSLKQKVLYSIFSWFVMVVGTQLFGIAMVFGYLIYIIGWIIFWFFFIIIFGNKEKKNSVSYTLEDGTSVKERTGLLGEKSYIGSDGSDYDTSDYGQTFTKK
ncbi:hypothetical protein [Barnesiella intestinihominis]|uniref:hypothetical protein n=1 Tax=Barnesiella intestinihominis TaxID=487174 RepID=UPI00398449FE